MKRINIPIEMKLEEISDEEMIESNVYSIVNA